MKEDEIPDNALAVAMDIFDLFECVDGMVEYDVQKATDLIEAYAGRRIREALGVGRGRIGFT
jgi:hypothetical protein